MFSFDDSVRSVAIDVGAATNPLSFDLPVDSSQVAFFVEPVQWKTIEEDLATNFKRVKASGGCGKQYDPACIHDRALVFPAAVSENLAHATFHVTANPYCGSLEAFTGSKEVQKSKNPDVRGIFDACYKDAGQTRDVPTISLKSIIERIPKSISVKYIKIDAQGHDFKVLLSAGDQMSRIDYVRLEMQVYPPPGFKLVKDVPSYAEIKKRLEGFGFKHEGEHACHFDGGASPFSKAVKEMECVFCRRPPCVETGRAPMGPNPASKSMMSKYYGQEYVQPPPWKIPADMDTRETRS
jgi:FkbM family methyltransferase